MKAAILKNTQTIQVEEVDYLQPDPGYITIDTQSSGICGSDLHAYHGAWGFSEQAGGHELCGIVKEVGGGVTLFQIGDRVVVEAVSGCGECIYCKQGIYNVCQNLTGFKGNGHGGFAEYTTAHESSVFKVPDNMTFEQGSLVEPLAVCYRALMESGATSQDRVAIIGGGSIGLLCLAVAKAIGVKETLIVVKYPQQAEIAKAYDADHVVNISDTNVQNYCAGITNSMGFDVVIETTSSESAFNDAVSIIRRRGAIVLVGIYTKPVSVNLNNIVVWEVNIKGSMCYSYSGTRNDFVTTIDLIASGKVDPTKIITHRFPLDEATEAFKTANDKSTGSIKVNIYQS